MKHLAERFPIYSKILKLYPASYQQKYGEQMLQTLADMLDDAPSPMHRGVVWLRTVLDLPVSLAQQQMHYAGNAFANETPRFVRRNALVSLVLFAPFVAIVIVNDATAHGLYHTWLWSVGVLLTWIIVLPALGFLLSISTLFVWLAKNHKRGILKNLSDVRHNWPMTAAVLFGLGLLTLVFFHDSVHCVTGNPVRELRNFHDTWRCIQQR